MSDESKRPDTVQQVNATHAPAPRCAPEPFRRKRTNPGDAKKGKPLSPNAVFLKNIRAFRARLKDAEAFALLMRWERSREEFAAAVEEFTGAEKMQSGEG